MKLQIDELRRGPGSPGTDLGVPRLDAKKTRQRADSIPDSYIVGKLVIATGYAPVPVTFIVFVDADRMETVFHTQHRKYKGTVEL
jgi:hypothetical protein